jgi:hypothetical protein
MFKCPLEVSNNIENKRHIKDSLKSKIVENTHLKEIYGKNKKQYIEDIIEPIYESMRIKFRQIYKSEPSHFIRVPYLVNLLGDNITEIFDDQMVTSIEKDFIICWNISQNDLKLKFEFFDKFSPLIEHEIGQEYKENKENENLQETGFYLIQGFLSGINVSKPKYIKGANFLINYNIPNLSIKEYKISSFISTFLSSLHVHESLNKVSNKNLYELCFNELNRIGNFQKDLVIVRSKLLMEPNFVGIQLGNEFKSIKINPNNRILIFDSFSSQAPTTIAALNFWNKRKVEFRLGLALILKRYKKDLSKDEIIELSKDMKKFLYFFENNMETVFGLIE